MPSYSLLTENLQAYAEQLIANRQIPGVSLALWKDGKLTTGAAGVLNLNTGAKFTPDSISQIGSITKVMTTTLVMQLVDEGKVDLDTPVQHYLRDFMIADDEATKTITVRQLLNHTNGIAGDYFPDDRGHQGNLIARYVDRCSYLPLTHPIGKGFSYSNAAFAIAGRIIEVMRGISFYEALETYIYKPLGMTHAIADPADTVLFSAASGHVTTALRTGGRKQADESDDSENAETTESKWMVPDRAYLTMGQAPAGTTPTMRATDLITFARAHMDGGVTQYGERFLSEKSISIMQTPHYELEGISQRRNAFIGLGWFLNRYPNGVASISHSGATNGYLANLVVFPEHDIAFALLLNNYDAAAAQKTSKDLMQALFNFDTTEPEPRNIPRTRFMQSVTGEYSCVDSDISVFMEDNALYATIYPKNDPIPPYTVELKHLEENSFASYPPGGERGPNLVFSVFNEKGVPRYLSNCLRLNTRQGDA